MLAPARYRPVTYEEVPELRKALRRVEDPFRASDIIPHLPVSMRDYEPRELGRALIYRGVAERTGDGRLRRRHGGSSEGDRGGRPEQVPGLSERPRHPRDRGEPAQILHGLRDGVGGGQAGGAQGQEAAGPRDEILEVEKMTTDTAISSESQDNEARKCEDCGGYRSERCELCRGMSEYYVKEKKGRKAKAEPTPENTELTPKDCHDCAGFEDCVGCDGCEGAIISSHRAGSNYREKGGPLTPAGEAAESGELAPSAEEPSWDTYHDRAAEAPDPMMEEAKGEPVMETPEEQALVPVRPDEPWWSGGPLDTVDGLPWNLAVLRVPKDSYMMLLPGKYNYGGMEAELTKPLRLDGENGPYEPDVIVQNILLYNEQEGKDKAEESSRVEYRGGASGQSTLGGEPMVRGSIERRPVVQVKVEVDKFRLTTTEEGLDNARELEKSELEQWVYHKMKPLSKDTYVSGTDWPEGCGQIMAVIKGAA